jgi:hypothetical protein
VKLRCIIRMITREVVISHEIFGLHTMCFQALEPSEYGAQSHIELTLCKSKSIHRQSTSLKQMVSLFYCMPTHCLLPFPNATRYFSEYCAFSGSSHRVGSKVSGSGKWSGYDALSRRTYPLLPVCSVGLVYAQGG